MKEHIAAPAGANQNFGLNSVSTVNLTVIIIKVFCQKKTAVTSGVGEQKFLVRQGVQYKHEQPSAKNHTAECFHTAMKRTGSYTSVGTNL